LVHRHRRDDDVLPHLLEQLLDADHLTGMLCEAYQQPHGTRFELGDLALALNLVERGIDAQRADTKYTFECGTTRVF
jgi:hypothetical protein